VTSEDAGGFDYLEPNVDCANHVPEKTFDGTWVGDDRAGSKWYADTGGLRQVVRGQPMDHGPFSNPLEQSASAYAQVKAMDFINDTSTRYILRPAATAPGSVWICGCGWMH